MEVERQRYAASVTGVSASGTAVVGPEHKVGPAEKFEFGAPNDTISYVVGGSYVTNWNSDFLQRELGKEGTCARFYFDKRVAVDIANPEDKISRRKRKLLFRHGFGYLCIPTGFENSGDHLRRLYQAALDEYFAYEKEHPRPKVFQEAMDISNDGVARRVMMTAIDIRVGGGLVGSETQQQAELKQASTKLSSSELKTIKMRSKLHRKLRHSIQSGTPFRNPYVAKDKRLYPVEYVN